MDLGIIIEACAFNTLLKETRTILRVTSKYETNTTVDK